LNYKIPTPVRGSSLHRLAYFKNVVVIDAAFWLHFCVNSIVPWLVVHNTKLYWQCHKV